jgi:putative FmdB family regulatory protein
MPIYAYRCESCGHAKDVLQKVSDPLLSTCPACGAESFRKQLTAAGFQLKGSGWYVTDFRGGANNGAAKSDDAAKPDAAKPDAAKPEATRTDAAKADAAPAATPAAPAASGGTAPAAG